MLQIPACLAAAALTVQFITLQVQNCLLRAAHLAAEAETLLTACYENSLKLAREKGLKTIAFPLISAGVYGYPQRDAIRVAIETMKLHQDDFDEITLVLFGEREFAAFTIASQAKVVMSPLIILIFPILELIGLESLYNCKLIKKQSSGLFFY